MGGAGGAGLVSALCRAGTPDGEQDEGIGGEDGQTCGGDDEGGTQDHHHLVEPGFRTWERQEWWDFTVEVIDNIWATEGQSEETGGVHQGVQATSSVGAHHQPHTDPVGHDNHVVQRLTDGHVAVVCHDGQEDGIRGDEDHAEEKLCDAAIERNDVPTSEEARQELWSHRWRIADVQKGEVAEEEVHGGVKLWVSPDEDNHSQVSHQSGDVDE